MKTKNTISSNAKTTQQINWVGVRGNREPLDASSVMLSYTELQEELADEHSSLYAGQYTSVADLNNNVVTPYFVTYNTETTTYTAYEVALKTDYSYLTDKLQEDENVISYMSNYLYANGIDTEEIVSIAITYLYTYITSKCAGIYNEQERIISDLFATHKEFIAHTDIGDNHDYTNADNVWVSYTTDGKRLNRIVEELYTASNLTNLDVKNKYDDLSEKINNEHSYTTSEISKVNNEINNITENLITDTYNDLYTYISTRSIDIDTSEVNLGAIKLWLEIDENNVLKLKGKGHVIVTEANCTIEIDPIKTELLTTNDTVEFNVTVKMFNNNAETYRYTLKTTTNNTYTKDQGEFTPENDTVILQKQIVSGTPTSFEITAITTDNMLEIQPVEKDIAWCYRILSYNQEITADNWEDAINNGIYNYCPSKIIFEANLTPENPFIYFALPKTWVNMEDDEWTRLESSKHFEYGNLYYNNWELLENTVTIPYYINGIQGVEYYIFKYPVKGNGYTVWNYIK